MAQFFSPASTFLVKNTPEIDPMEAWGKCTGPMGRRLFSWMKQSAQFIPLYSPILYSPYGACTVIGNSNNFQFRKMFTFYSWKIHLRGVRTPFLSTKKRNLPTSPHPNLQRKKQRQEKNIGTNPPRAQHPQAPTRDEWHTKAMHSGLIATGGSCSTALALLPEVWQATNIHLPNSAPKNGQRFPAFPQDLKKGWRTGW